MEVSDNILGFSINKMEETKEFANKYKEAYQNAINSIDNDMKLLQESLKTDEVKIYSELIDKYNEKKQYLTAIRDYMVEFINKLEEKIRSYYESANETKNSFD